MTNDDAFDARLKAAFASAQDDYESDTDSAEAFVKRVQNRVARPDRRRILILGAAGSTGSAIAGTQLESFFSNVTIPSEGIMASIAGLASPEVMAAGVIAIMISGFAFILPKQI
ncbi:MAG: hypothetical protein CMF74_02215 [Maricaulis sp.]|jgi:hypothetical protein|nr:hypothetical protein [Maricaulis sp.]HAQ34680.1 hypothetical protein [Alphaproteobacteria bacterium]|tara:strand:+ start:772 stop:1113 length:342 start_codon:yes stop_codon:yes gene_type:complete